MRIKPEMLQAVGQLHATARDPGMILALDDQLVIPGYHEAGFIKALGIAVHQPGHDQGLGTRPALRQTTLNQRNIKPRFFELC